MRIGIAFDLVPKDRPAQGRDDRYEEYDKPETIEAIAEVLEAEGHDVVLLGDGRAFLVNVLDERPDFVWNSAEGEGVGRCREARVPAALEMLGIPFTGSDPLTLAVALDKSAAKTLVQAARVTVPCGLVLPDQLGWDEAEAILTPWGEKVPLPWLLKPTFEGSSKGIRDRCLVDSPAEALAVFLELADGYGQPILVEEYVAGDEVTVGIIGNDPQPEVLGAMRIAPSPPDDRFVYSLDRKRVWNETIVFETPARLPKTVEKRLFRAALDAYRALGCRDVARIDFRVRDGVPYFLEANPLPGLAPDWSDLVLIARGAGLSYADLIRRILDTALARVGLTTDSSKGGPA